MPDAADFAAMFTSFKAITDIAKSLIDAHDATIRREKSIELQREIIAAQQGALTAQTAQSSLLKRVGELEIEVADLKAWDTEKEKYQLIELRKSVARGHGERWLTRRKKRQALPNRFISFAPNASRIGANRFSNKKPAPGWLIFFTACIVVAKLIGRA